jgi:hypothetical protein
MVARMHKVVIICQVEADTPYEAEEIMRAKVRPFRDVVEKLFASRGDTAKGWLGALRQQLLG